MFLPEIPEISLSFGGNMKLFHLLSFRDSRKVGFGLWLFIIATFLLWYTKILSADWSTCAILSASLIGGGTLGDAFLKKKEEKKEDKL
jgi:hypothetical protein